MLLQRYCKYLLQYQKQSYSKLPADGSSLSTSSYRYNRNYFRGYHGQVNCNSSLTCFSGLSLNASSLLMTSSMSKVPGPALTTQGSSAPSGKGKASSSASAAIFCELWFLWKFKLTAKKYFSLTSFFKGKMASAVRVSWNWLKMAWGTQPVLFVSVVMGVVGGQLDLIVNRIAFCVVD